MSMRNILDTVEVYPDEKRKIAIAICGAVILGSAGIAGGYYGYSTDETKTQKLRYQGYTMADKPDTTLIFDEESARYRKGKPDLIAKGNPKQLGIITDKFGQEYEVTWEIPKWESIFSKRVTKTKQVD